jgi:hypothetical protein
MVLKRQSAKGQSIFAALLKMLGTLLPFVLFFLRFPSSLLLNLLYISIFLCDWNYDVLLHAKYRELGIDPWKKNLGERSHA